MTTPVLHLDKNATFKATFNYNDPSGTPIDISAYTSVSVTLVAGNTISFDESDPQVTITAVSGQIDLLVTTVQIRSFTDNHGTIRIVLTNPDADIEDIVELVDGVFSVVE